MELRLNIYIHCLIVILLRPPAPRVFFNFLKFKINYFLKKRKVSHSPISLVIYANKICNFKCDFCFTYDSLNNERSSHYDLTKEKLLSILDTEMGKNSLRVGILGGEPFLNKNIFELIEVLKQKRKISTIVTNSSLLSGEKLKRLQESSLDVLGLSLYDNNWEDVKRVACAMNEAKKKYWVQAVISISTINEMEKIIEFNIQIGNKNLLFANYQPIFTGKISETILRGNQDYLKEESRLKSKYAKQISISWVPLVDPTPAKKNCTMPFSYVHVDAQGELGACCFRPPNEKKYGSIFHHDSWNLPYYIKLRENMFTDNTKGLDECNMCENLQCDLYKV